MNFRPFLTLSAFLLAPLATIGAEDKPEPYELKNRSTFEVSLTERTPFWPIGWKRSATVAAPGPRIAAATPAAFQIQPSHFVVTTILLGNPPLVTINGRAFGEGELLPVVVGKEPVRVVVKSIRDGGVVLDQSGHQIFVPMRRQQLVPRPVSDAAEPLAQEFQIVIPGR